MIHEKEVKSILNKHKKRDNWFLDDYSVNPYEGCGFNCQYCYIRGSKYGENLAEKIVIKKNAAEILDRQLATRARKNEYGLIAVGSATDAYMQIEEERLQTRKLLEVILKHRFPVFISTKSTLVKRDIDLLLEISQKAILPDGFPITFTQRAVLAFSFSTLDPGIARILEPGAPAPAARMETLMHCREAGLLAGVNAIPLLPFISDTDKELENLVRRASEHKAEFLLAGGLTLFGNQPGDSRMLFQRFLQKQYPSLIPQYEKLFKRNYFEPRGYHEDLGKRTSLLCKKYGIRDRILPNNDQVS
jgi:DNA repair photolyase